MTSAEVRAGDSYVVQVPAQLGTGHPLVSHEGKRFEVVIVETGHSVGTNPALLVDKTSWDGVVTIVLTEEQKVLLGLPTSGMYAVLGILLGEDGVVEHPATERMTIPVSWLVQPAD